MKLLYCPRCQDMTRLIKQIRYCSCRMSYGRYKIDGLRAEVGGLAIPVGFENNSFAEALKNQPEEGDGKRFEAFVIPKKCPSIENMDKPVRKKKGVKIKKRD